ncbi:EAL domain-containing protein [Acinetobacter nectaris]|uniref:bifunctional diguanylate cyclase/phosphodiesterase n=1 Tax=Acinetobacter nectaris TaxID=1219382 RepID=UPI001F27D41F|nr:EAL domain-containing protein [Acinetobacter nectaris]MCF9033423.1 EAL domain-containing protein [Acinetobacter nectaris]
MFALGYDTWLVIGSTLVTLITSYTTFATEHILFKNFNHKKYKKLIIITTGTLLAASIWSMHLIKIFADHYLENIIFDIKLIATSYFIVLLASIFSIWLVTSYKISFLRLAVGAIVLGVGIIGMNYTEQLAISIPYYHFEYSPKMVILSIVWSAVGAGCTLWFAYKIRVEKDYVILLRVIVSMLLTSTIVGLHYLGMLSLSINHLPDAFYHSLADRDNSAILGLILIIFAIFIIVLFICLLENSLEKRNIQLHRANKKLKYLIAHDHLTRLPNRSYLSNHIKIVLSEHKLHRQNLAFLFMDLDRFKAINDAFGNYIGDELLILFSNRVTKFIKQENKLFRINGDEFLLIAEHTNLEQAELLAQGILDIMQEGFNISGHKINITLSIGISIFPEFGENLQDLMMHADIAKLVAKEQGRNTYSVFNYQAAEYTERNQSRLMNDLFSAIADGEFILFYQPKFNDSRKIFGVEALIRWQHPTLGLLTPNKFIPLAEKTGFIIPIGYWVLDQACKQISLWEKQGLDLYPISINLSALQIEHKNLIQTLEEKITQYEIDPNHLMIEVTETTAMHHIDFSIHIFKKIRELGVGLSIDDFGTGHSSFLYLKDLPVNELKIDRAFIKNLEPHSKDEAILDSIIKLTQHLGLSITAEGVETEAQFEILKRLGCYSFQGFLLGKPVPKEVLKIQFLSSKIAANAMKKH